jgi:hypothetical protein
MSNDKCVVLVPVGGSIEAECERGLRVLEARGYVVRRVTGYAAIDQGRSQMATDALADGFEELMWIDADIGFDADAVDGLRRTGLPFVCGVYPKKGLRELAIHVKPGAQHVVFGEEGGLTPIHYAATGFLLTHRRVYDSMQQKLGLPVCNTRFDRPIVPYFLPMVVPDGDGQWYLGEDFAFSERARQAGFDIVADTRVRLHHIGKYAYSWEDSGISPARYATFTLNLG